MFNIYRLSLAVKIFYKSRNVSIALFHRVSRTEKHKNERYPVIMMMMMMMMMIIIIIIIIIIIKNNQNLMFAPPPAIFPVSLSLFQLNLRD